MARKKRLHRQSRRRTRRSASQACAVRTPVGAEYLAQGLYPATSARPHRGRIVAWNYAHLTRLVCERDDWRCLTCDTRRNLTVHHLVPRSLGGPDWPLNLVVICHECHQRVHRSVTWGWAWFASQVLGTVLGRTLRDRLGEGHEILTHWGWLHHRIGVGLAAGAGRRSALVAAAERRAAGRGGESGAAAPSLARRIGHGIGPHGPASRLPVDSGADQGPDRPGPRPEGVHPRPRGGR